jgi:surface protein
MKPKVIANNDKHLRKIIKHEMEINGKNCDLNHIDVSKVIGMQEVFADLEFNGDISQWDVSNVVSMRKMFNCSDFNGDISKWNVSKVESMDHMFSKSKFVGNIDNWTPYSLQLIHPIRLFGTCLPPVIIPYWANYKDVESRVIAINAYQLKNGLEQELNANIAIPKRNKI